jgi:adenosylmethionine-8-amino-7-oxononanoate aminotransferase
LEKVFFSDDGSTAMEVALKLAFEAARRTRGIRSPKFLSMGGAYHGDTVGAMALGHSAVFHKAYRPLLFRTDEVMSPYCYRCPFNRARPERADARDYRKCNWECVDKVERAFSRKKRRGEPYAGFVFEPLIQGAAGMIAQPQGWLRQAAEIARAHGAYLIADEVMTGFGRTGMDTRHATRNTQHVLFACAHEGVQPDLMALAKGLTGGYLPMGATLTTQEIFDAFLGDYEEFKSFFHGHSFTANQLGAAAALASLDILQSAGSIRSRLEHTVRAELQTLWSLPNIGDIRQVGLVAGIELVKDWRTREAFDLRERVGIRVCEAMAKRGVLTRPIGNVIVLMPPYCTTATQMSEMVDALRRAVTSVLVHF